MSKDYKDGELIDLTNVTPERGHFAPSEIMLGLTDIFIEAIKIKFPTAKFTKQGNETYLLVGREVYRLYNNGIKANIQFVGFHS